MQIIVLGTHRSGASIVTRLINEMGAYFDADQVGNASSFDNHKGFWEREDVVKANDAILASQNCRWNQLHGWNFLRGSGKKPQSVLAEVGTEIERITKLMEPHQPWLLKDPRLCLTLPLWKKQLNNPVIVMVSRSPAEIAFSFKKKHHYALAQGLCLWEYYTVSMLNHTRGMKCIYVNHHDLMEQPKQTMETLLSSLKEHGAEGLKKLKDSHFKAFLDSNLYASKIEKGEVGRIITPWQQSLYQMASGIKDVPSAGVEVSAIAKDNMAFYEEIERKQAKFTETNRKFAAAEQQANTLDRQLGDYKREMEGICADYESQIAGLKARITDLSSPQRSGIFGWRKKPASTEENAA